MNDILGFALLGTVTLSGFALGVLLAWSLLNAFFKALPIGPLRTRSARSQRSVE